MNPTNIHVNIQQSAEKAYSESNPFSLQMVLHYMDQEELRELMNWTDDETSWKPKLYPEDRSHYRIVADAMLRYYYYRFSSAKDGNEWEDADGQADFEEDPKFMREREYWSKISIDNSAPIYPYKDHEDIDELAALDQFRAKIPRLFSRDNM